MYEDRLKLPARDSLEDASNKQRFGENTGQLLDPNHLLKSSSVAGQPSGQVLHGTTSVMSPQLQGRSQQLPGSTPEIKTEMNPVLNPRAGGADSLMGIPGSNQSGNNLTLKGWPLTGLDQLRSGILQQQKPFLQGGPQPFHNLQMLSPQHQQLMLAQQNMTSSSAGDADSRRLKMLMNSRNMGLGKDGLLNNMGDGAMNIGSMQTGGSVLHRGDPEMLLKLKMAQLQQQQHQQNNNNNNNQQQQQQMLLQQHALSGQQPQTSNHSLHQQDKINGSGSVTADVSTLSNSFRGNDQASKNQAGRKRKQVSSSGPANSTGTANTTGPSPGSGPSTPSTHTPGDGMPHTGTSSKPLMMFGSDGTGTLTSSSNQLWDDKELEMPAEIDRFVEDGSLDDNVESFLSHDDADPRDTAGRGMDVSKGFTFNEVSSIRASTSKVICCHFSSDGKLLASGGHDKKAVLWYTDSLKPKATLEEHSCLITDVRFSPNMPRLATSSFDKNVRAWDVENPGYSLRNFTGHAASVMSLDFHPNKDDLICSCDGDGEIRYWSINNGSCSRVFKGGTAQVRFQPRHGRYLAAAAENVVSILDVETQACRQSSDNTLSAKILTKVKQNLAFRSKWAELNGAMGDLGTYIPIVLALTLVKDLNLGTTLIFTGFYNLVTGLVYGVPMPVQPMKSIAAVAISSAGSEFGIAEIMAAGICTGGILFLLGVTRLMQVVYRLIPLPVVRGIQLSQGLAFALSAVKYITKAQDFSKAKKVTGDRPWLGLDGLVLALFCACFIIVVNGAGEKQESDEGELGNQERLTTRRKLKRIVTNLPSAFIVFALGLIFAIARRPEQIKTLSFGPSSIKVIKISKKAWKQGFLKGTIPQLPLSVLNSVIAVCKLSSDLFPEKDFTATSVSVTVGLMNIVGCWFGAMPCCHGAGGLAGQYKFGGRSGACVALLGVVKLVLGLVLGGSMVMVLNQFPIGVLGVLLLFAGIELAMASKDMNSKEEAFVMLLCAAVSLVGSSAALGFLCGIVVHLLLKLRSF